MSERPADHVSEQEAARLWRRAAELQAEAAARSETEDAEPEASLEDADGDDAEGYALEHVRAAALEAGIGEEFVDEAFGELSATRVLPAAPPGLFDRLSRGFLGRPPDNLEASRIIHATPDAVLAAMERVFPRQPYSLVLKDKHGDPRSGGTLAFEIEGASFVAQENWTGQASWADMREVYASLRPLRGSAPACELTLRSPVAWARRINASIGAAMTGLGGALGAALGTAAGTGIAALAAGLGAVGTVIVVAAAVAGALGGGGAGWRILRLLYDHGLGKGKKALVVLLGAVAMEAEGGWGFDALPRAEAPDRLERGAPSAEDL